MNSEETGKTLKEVLYNSDIKEKEYFDKYYMVSDDCTPEYVNLTVNFLTKYYISNNLKKSFQIPLLGASIAGELDAAMNILKSIKSSSDNNVIENACKLSGYIPCLYKGKEYLIPPEGIDTDIVALSNIKIMLQRNLEFLKKQNDKFSIEILDTGKLYGTYKINQCIWNLIPLSSSISTLDLRKILFHISDKYDKFKDIKQVGIFNAATNISYLINKDQPVVLSVY